MPSTSLIPAYLVLSILDIPWRTFSIAVHYYHSYAISTQIAPILPAERWRIDEWSYRYFTSSFSVVGIVLPLGYLFVTNIHSITRNRRSEDILVRSF